MEQLIMNQNRKEFENNLIVKALKDESFKDELITNPRAVYERELGKSIPESISIEVIEETPDKVYLVLPSKPEVTEELSDAALEAVAGGAWIIMRGRGGGFYFIDQVQR